MARTRMLAAVLLGLVPTACGNVNFFSEEEEAQLGREAYAEATKDHRVITTGADAAMLQQVGSRIAQATGVDYQWEFKLLEAPDTVNAFCLPGGKVAVYSGILPITQDADGLAVVLGHEIAHATLHHGAKRMSQGILAEGVLSAVAAGVSLAELEQQNQELILSALGIGTQVGVLLPYSREHESEADEVGLRYAIRAGYDPWVAPKLWERMAQLGGSGPAWLSTHPDPLDRAEALRAKIPELLAEERGPATAPAAAQPGR